MAIVYPLAFPTIRGISEIRYRAARVDAVSQSPLTYVSQIVKHQGQRYEADITVPPMDRAEAEMFVSFLLKLDGRSGSFLFTPPEGRNPRGTVLGAPLVNGAGQTGNELIIDGLTGSTAGHFLPGDWVQLGGGATASLYKVLDQVDSDAGGNAALTIWPNMRQSPADDSIVTYVNPAGVYRLESPVVDWSVDEATVYGIAFGVVEAI